MTEHPSIYNIIFITEYFSPAQVDLELLCSPTPLDNHNDHVDTQLRECNRLLVWIKRSIVCIDTHRECVQVKKHYVPERIRAAGFTDLRLYKPQRDDLTTNRQGLYICPSLRCINAEETRQLPPAYLSPPADQQA